MINSLEQLNRKIYRDALERASVHDRLRGLSATEILDVFPHEELIKLLPIEERMQGLSIAEIEDYLRKLKIKKSLVK